MNGCDMSARLAAIKDIPTERLIELAVAEAEGRIVIPPSAADIAHEAVMRGECAWGGRQHHEH